MGTGVQVSGWYESKPKKRGEGETWEQFVALLQCRCPGLAAVSLSLLLQLTAGPVVPGWGHPQQCTDRGPGGVRVIAKGRPRRGPGEERKGDGEFNNKEA